MGNPDTNPEDVPEGDAAEQATPTDPTNRDDELVPDMATPIDVAEAEADPVDAWEQFLPGPDQDDDDAYEHTT